MKKQLFHLPALVLAMFIFTYSCEEDTTSPRSDSSTGYEFITMHYNEDSDSMPYLSLMNIHDGELHFSHLTDIYPLDFNSWKRVIHQNNGILGFMLHRDLSETVSNPHGSDFWRPTGVWMDIRDGEVHELPTLGACLDFGYDAGCSRYSYTLRHSVRIGNSGHIFYIASSAYYAGSWHDEERYRIVRLDPQTGDYEAAPLISNWTLSQPEIDTDRYGLARINDKIFPSACGRYVYGRTAAWGISGGTLIASGGIIFRYDFDNEEFTRVEEIPYRTDLNYITADDRHIIYNHDRNNYRYDTQTGQVAMIDGHPGTWMYQVNVNNFGVINDPFPMRILGYRNVVDDENTEIRIPRQARRPMFSADGKKAYFRYHNCEMNYLLRVSDLTEEATVDTVAKLPPNVRVMTIL